MAQVLEVLSRERLRVVRLNRPERKNALNDELLGALIVALRDAAHDDDVWAIAITGNGDAFCSGLDLNQNSGEADSEGDANDESSAERDDASNHLSLLMRVECEKPILAGVNGVAVGIGLSLAMNADIRIAAPSARFHPGYARVATSPDGGLTWTLTRAVGYERAMRFLLEQKALPQNRRTEQTFGAVSSVLGQPRMGIGLSDPSEGRVSSRRSRPTSFTSAKVERKRADADASCRAVDRQMKSLSTRTNSSRRSGGGPRSRPTLARCSWSLASRFIL